MTLISNKSVPVLSTSGDNFWQLPGRKREENWSERFLLKENIVVCYFSLIIFSTVELTSFATRFARREQCSLLNLHGLFLQWLEEGDACVVDRGFRDVFEESEFETKMPAFLMHGTSKHNWGSNQVILSYYGTMACRSVTWAMNKWLFLIQWFDMIWLIHLVPWIGFSQQLWIHSDQIWKRTDSLDAEIARAMLKTSWVNRNALFCRIEKGLFSGRVNYSSFYSEDTVTDFPLLSPGYLQVLIYSYCRLKQAKSYARENVLEEGAYNIEVQKTAAGLLRTQIHSVHINDKRSITGIEYTKEICWRPSTILVLSVWGVQMNMFCASAQHKTCNKTCVTSKDSDQPVHPPIWQGFSFILHFPQWKVWYEYHCKGIFLYQRNKLIFLI